MDNKSKTYGDYNIAIVKPAICIYQKYPPFTETINHYWNSYYKQFPVFPILKRNARNIARHTRYVSA